MIDCHLMVDDPAHHFQEFAASGGDCVTFHVEAVTTPCDASRSRARAGLGVGVAFNPETAVAGRGRRGPGAPTSSSA